MRSFSFCVRLGFRFLIWLFPSSTTNPTFRPSLVHVPALYTFASILLHGSLPLESCISSLDHPHLTFRVLKCFFAKLDETIANFIVTEASFRCVYDFLALEKRFATIHTFANSLRCSRF